MTYTSATTGICTVSGSSVSLIGAGTCTINADQAGDANWAAATRVQQSFAVSRDAIAVSLAASAVVAWLWGPQRR